MMKTLTLLIAWCLLITSAFSQTPESVVDVVDGSESFENGSHPVLKVTIFDASESDIEKAWKREMKKNKAKVSSKKEIFADNVQVKGFGNNPSDMYAKIAKLDDRKCQLSVATDLGGAYLNGADHSEKHTIMKAFLKEFGIAVTKEAIRGQLKDAEKALKKLEKEQENLKKQNEKLTASLKTNEEDQIKKKAEIVHQITEVEAIKAKEAAVK